MNNFPYLTLCNTIRVLLDVLGTFFIKVFWEGFSRAFTFEFNDVIAVSGLDKLRIDSSKSRGECPLCELRNILGSWSPVVEATFNFRTWIVRILLG